LSSSTQAADQFYHAGRKNRSRAANDEKRRVHPEQFWMPVIHDNPKPFGLFAGRGSILAGNATVANPYDEGVSGLQGLLRHRLFEIATTQMTFELG
jgi:hypothetical protein